MKIRMKFWPCLLLVFILDVKQATCVICAPYQGEASNAETTIQVVTAITTSKTTPTTSKTASVTTQTTASTSPTTASTSPTTASTSPTTASTSPTTASTSPTTASTSLTTASTSPTTASTSPTTASTSATTTPEETTSQSYPTEWPAGRYGLQAPVSGCPDGNWRAGSRYQDSEDDSNQNSWTTDNHFAGELNQYGIEQVFCIKRTIAGNYNWSAGNYCILKKGPCPSGFSKGFLKWDDEDTDNANTFNISSGLPNGKYNNDTKILYCCRNDGSPSDEIYLPISKPFYLIKYEDTPCQTVAGMTATEEMISWDDEDNSNNNKMRWAHPLSDGDSENHRMHFCYYSASST